ncbi:MAG: hypothetical protein K2N21_01105 [Rikenellaceae bacterium]|nr:hypothetical protein [Rikenellaceae bacterium]
MNQIAAAIRFSALCAVLMHIVLALLILVGLSACRSAAQVADPVVLNDRGMLHVVDSVHDRSLRVDSFFSRDSVVIYRSGDTLWRTDVRWRDRLRVRVDTLWRSRVDTLLLEREVPVEVPVPVARSPSRGSYSLVLVALGAIFGAGIVLFLRRRA